MSDVKKCAHNGCQCTAAPDSKYCSTFCSDSAAQDLTTLKCDCGHAACEATQL
jgi:hypothetical protein